MSKTHVLDSLKWYLEIARINRVALHHYHRDNPGDRGLGDPSDREHFARLASWYASLYVVYEGWTQLVKLPNERLDRLISESADQIAALARFRNKTFHAQKTYPSKHLLEYISTEDSVLWSYQMSDALTHAIYADSPPDSP